MGWAADAVNKVYDLLKAAAVPAGDLPFFRAVYFGEQDVSITNAKPLMIVHLGSPAYTERWVAAQNIKESELKILVSVMSEPKDSITRPYGETGAATKTGALEAAETVMNFLDNNRAAIVAANGKIVDFNLTLEDNGNVGDKTWEFSLTINIKARFIAGQR